MKRFVLRILRRFARPSYARAGQHTVNGRLIRIDIVPYNRALLVSAEDGVVALELNQPQSVPVITEFGTGVLTWEPGPMRLMNS